MLKDVKSTQRIFLNPFYNHSCFFVCLVFDVRNQYVQFYVLRSREKRTPKKLEKFPKVLLSPLLLSNFNEKFLFFFFLCVKQSIQNNENVQRQQILTRNIYCVFTPTRIIDEGYFTSFKERIWLRIVNWDKNTKNKTYFSRSERSVTNMDGWPFS